MQASKKHSFLRRSPLAYVVVPLAFVLVSTALVFIVGHTMLAPYQALLGWFFSTTEVAQPRDLLDNAATVINGGTVDEPDAQPDRLPLSSVAYPSEGDRYATITITGTNVDAPVYYGDTNKILNAGVGTYKGDTAIDTRNAILNTTYDNLINDLNSRGVEVTSDVESAVVVVADACRLDYANYVTVPLASQLYTFIEKCSRVVPVAVAIMAVLCAVSLFVMLRLAGSSRYGVRCLTFAFTAAAALCALAATIIFPAIHMEALSINPASVKQLIVTYVQNLFGRFGLFALIYGAVAVILLALTATARSRMKRRQNI